jgi:hypothetical protein
MTIWKSSFDGEGFAACCSANSNAHVNARGPTNRQHTFALRRTIAPPPGRVQLTRGLLCCRRVAGNPMEYGVHLE